MEKRLYKSSKNQKIDGVCAGIAEYCNIDPTLVRVGAVLMTLAGGSGILVYIICAIIMPRDPN
jgi:phage shock protein PspC (stress-responsive transcriptional regulator)